MSDFYIYFSFFIVERLSSNLATAKTFKNIVMNIQTFSPKSTIISAMRQVIAKQDDYYIFFYYYCLPNAQRLFLLWTLQKLFKNIVEITSNIFYKNVHLVKTQISDFTKLYDLTLFSAQGAISLCVFMRFVIAGR